MATRVVIYDTRLRAMNAPGGMVNEYVRHKTETTAIIARGAAPKRTGHLAASIVTRVSISPSAQGTIGTVTAKASYAKFVHEGTRGPIIATHSKRGLWVPKVKGGFKREWRDSVRGQAAQPFLSASLEFVMATSRFVGRR